MNGAFGTTLSLAIGLVLTLGLANLLRTYLEALVSRFEHFERDESESTALVEVLSHVTSLAVILTLNQFFGLTAFVPALILILVFLWKRSNTTSGWTIAAYAASATAISFCVVYALNLSGFWLTEGVNHDIFFYVRGGDWALSNGTLSADKVVSRSLIFGRETADCVWWIGDACRLHRGGTHTLAGLTGLMSGEVSPSTSYLVAAFLAAPLCSALMLNHAGKGAKPGLAIQTWPNLLTLMLATSAPVLTSLANGNAATALAAIAVMCSVLVFVSPSARTYPATASITLGALTGLCALLYSESMWVAAAVTALHVLLSSTRSPATSSLRRFFEYSGLALAAWIVAGNASILLAFRAFFTVSAEVTRDLYWPNYYLDVENWRWLSMPFAGWLEGTNQLYPSVIGAAGTLIVVMLCALSPNRVRLILSLLIAAFAVIVIEWTTYYYGAHKVVELFGGVVLAAAAACILQGMGASRMTPIGIVSLVASVALLAIQAHAIFSFSQRARSTLTGPYAPKAISYVEAALFEHLNEDDVALLNDLSWSGADRFSKTHWSAFLAEREKAKLVMGSFGGELYRGGYGASDRERTLGWHDRVDWVIQMHDLPDQRQFVFYDGAPVTSAGRFEFVDLRDRHLPAVFMSHGFHERELERIWTTGAFVIEVVSPRMTTDELPVLDFQMEFFAPPVDGIVTVLRNGSPLLQLPPTSGTITVPLAEGYQSIEFRPSWAPVSPADIGMSGDGRKLFAAIFRITSRLAPPPLPEKTDEAINGG